MIYPFIAKAYHFRFWKRLQGGTSRGGTFTCTNCGAEVPTGTRHRLLDCVEYQKQLRRNLYYQISELRERDLDALQEKINAWGRYNFPNAQPYQPLLGAVEELGELAHAHLKQEQGIRGTPEEWKAKKEDAIGDVIIYLLHYCVMQGLSLWACILQAWCEIKDRDWQKFPRNGRTE